MSKATPVPPNLHQQETGFESYAPPKEHTGHFLAQLRQPMQDNGRGTPPRGQPADLLCWRRESALFLLSGTWSLLWIGTSGGFPFAKW